MAQGFNKGATQHQDPSMPADWRTPFCVGCSCRRWVQNLISPSTTYAEAADHWDDLYCRKLYGFSARVNAFRNPRCEPDNYSECKPECCLEAGSCAGCNDLTLRRDVVTHLGIVEPYWDSLCLTVCCRPCTLEQTSQEIEFQRRVHSASIAMPTISRTPTCNNIMKK